LEAADRDAAQLGLGVLVLGYVAQFQIDEGAHDGDVHPHRTGGPENGGKHRNALFGNGVGQVTAAPVGT
jgi:hypothetical protein